MTLPFFYICLRIVIMINWIYEKQKRAAPMEQPFLKFKYLLFPCFNSFYLCFHLIVLVHSVKPVVKAFQTFKNVEIGRLKL